MNLSSERQEKKKKKIVDSLRLMLLIFSVSFITLQSEFSFNRLKLEVSFLEKVLIENILIVAPNSQFYLHFSSSIKHTT